jgi:hypothetical protein
VGKVNFPASGVGTPDPEKRCTGLEPLTIESVSLLSLRVLSEDMRYSNVSNIYLSYNLWTCKLFLSDSSQIVVVVRCCKNLCSFKALQFRNLMSSTAIFILLIFVVYMYRLRMSRRCFWPLYSGKSFLVIANHGE